MIVETIHVNFDELPQMASDHVSSDPGPQCSTTVLEQDSLSPGPQSQENVPQVAETVTTSNELELLYSPMFSELLNGNYPVVSKSSAVHAADNPVMKTFISLIDYDTNLVLVAKGYAQKEELILKSQLHQLLGWTAVRCSLHLLTKFTVSRKLLWSQTAQRAWYEETLQLPVSEDFQKHGMTSCDSIGTPMATKHLDADLSGTPVDQTKYRSMVGALMYLTASRPDIVHATCYCARYQANTD
ncbi:hypothetical protein Tco_0718399 [Tanacetum coccineum]